MSLLALVAASGPLFFSSRPGDDAPLQDVLSFLAWQASSSGGTTLTVKAVSLVGPTDPPFSPQHPYRLALDLARSGAGADYYRHQVGAWNSGRVASLAYDYDPSSAGRESPSLGLYWDGNCGVAVRFGTLDCQALYAYKALDVDFLPHEFFGYFAGTTLIALALHAQHNETLVFTSDGATANLRMPANPEFRDDFHRTTPPADLPVIDLTFDVREGVRVLEESYLTEGAGPYWTYRVSRWSETPDGHHLPAECQYTVFLSQFKGPGLEDSRSLRFHIEFSASAPAIDGAFATDCITSIGRLSVGGSRYLNDRGAELVLTEAAASLELQVPSSASTAHGTEATTREALTACEDRRSAGVPAWPALSSTEYWPEFMEQRGFFDASAQYCGQLSTTLIARMNAIPATFADVRDQHPAGVMSMQEVVAWLRGRGLEVAALNGNISDSALLSGPFLVASSPSTSTGHLGVVIPKDEREIRHWSPPGIIERMPLKSLRLANPGGIYLLPGRNVPAQVPLFLYFGTAGLLGVLGLVLFVRARRRLPGALVQTAASCMLLMTFLCGCGACSPEIVLLCTDQPRYDVTVDLGQTVPLSVRVTNLTAFPVEVLPPRPSCSCIWYLGAAQAVVPPHGAADLPFSVRGANLAGDEQEIVLPASANGHTQNLVVAVDVRVVNKLFLEPTQALAAIYPGSELASFFLCYSAPFPEELPPLECTVDPPIVKVKVTGKSTKSGYGGEIHRYECQWDFTDSPAGINLCNVAFAVPTAARTIEPLFLTVPVQVKRDP